MIQNVLLFQFFFIEYVINFGNKMSSQFTDLLTANIFRSKNFLMYLLLIATSIFDHILD